MAQNNEQQNFLDQPGLDLYDSLLKQYIKDRIEEVGDIVDTVPNEIIKMLWDGTVKFSDLVPVSGEKNYIPVTKFVNYLHFLKIFYTIDDLKQNAVTFTNNGESDFVFSVRCSKNEMLENVEFPKLFLVTDELEELSEYHQDPYESYLWTTDDITVAPGESVHIIGYNPEGLSMYTEDDWLRSIHFYERNQDVTDVTMSGNIMSLIDMIGSSKVIPEFSRFDYLFGNLSSLTEAEDFKLPATTLTDGCYMGMFSMCYNLMNVPALPATTLADNCYNCMFQECVSLTAVPKNYLPATVIAYGCYSTMFDYCTNLTNAPDLPATILAEGCYSYMFSYCESLIEVPKLPATKLAEACYMGMFSCCYSLTSAPELPATTLVTECYEDMFYECTSLTEAPVLPAKTLVDGCYYEMFYNCQNLSKVTCLAEDISADDCTYNWLQNVASEGTFIMNPQVVWSRGDSGIPTGWNVEFEEKDAPFVMIKSLGGPSTLYLNNLGSHQSLEISQDERNTWMAIEVEDKFSITPNQPLYIRGILSGDNDIDEGDYTNLMIRTGKVELYGNVNAIWDYHNLNASMKDECGAYLFSNSVAITKAPVLPSTNLSRGCYTGMFQYCSSLKKSPVLPATILSDPSDMGYGCYERMFQYCTSLTEAPDLLANIMTDSCYYEMFKGCTNLHWVKCLAESTGEESTYNWLKGVATYGVFIMTEVAYGKGFLDTRIPDAWMQDYLNNSLSVYGLYDGTYVSFDYYDNIGLFNKCPYSLEYSYQGGPWTKYNFGNPIYIDQGEVLRFRGNNNTPFSIGMDGDYTGLMLYVGNPYNLSGDITSLVNKEGCIKDLRKVLTDRSFIPEDEEPGEYSIGAFGCSYGSIFASTPVSVCNINLPSIYLTLNCYYSLFANTNLQEFGEILPAFDLASYCYAYMFARCPKLTYAPILPAATLVQGCYSHMFYNCEILEHISCFATNNISQVNTSNWVYSVNSAGYFYIYTGTYGAWASLNHQDGIPSNFDSSQDEPIGPYSLN